MIKKPVRAIVAAIDAAAARWSDPSFDPRVRARAAAAARTGYSLAAVDHAFDALFGSIRRSELEAIIASELGSLDVLDCFVESDARPAARALPIGRVAIVASRTTVGVAIVPAIFALCAKCHVLVKDREDHLVAAFFDTLSGELPELRAAARAQSWRGEDDAVSLREFDAVVAFGSDATLTTIGAHVGYPARFIGFGSKASAGYVTRETLADESDARELAAGAARDLVLYETEGCLSLHCLFVERGGAVSIERFAGYLQSALRDACRRFSDGPRGARRRAEARDLATFRGQTAVADAGVNYLTIVDAPLDEPPLFLPRAIRIHAIDDCAQAAHYFRRHGISLEALALSQARRDLLELAVAAGAARVAPFGTLQRPPLGAFHGGRPRIAEFVRWIGWEA